MEYLLRVLSTRSLHSASYLLQDFARAWPWLDLSKYQCCLISIVHMLLFIDWIELWGDPIAIVFTRKNFKWSRVLTRRKLPFESQNLRCTTQYLRFIQQNTSCSFCWGFVEFSPLNAKFCVLMSKRRIWQVPTQIGTQNFAFKHWNT